MRVCADDGRFSLNDVGCGYGALLSFLAERHPGRTVDYTGIDLSAAMVDAAERLWAGAPNLRFAQGSACPAPADYSVASGIFNVCQSIGRAEWERFVRATLHDMRQASRRAFSVNFMAPLAPGMPDVPELYRTAPQPWIDVCARELGGDVELLEGYGLREFTLLVRL